MRRHDCFARGAGFDEVIQNAVGDRFIERALIPIGREIKLERFAFNAEAVRNVVDVDPGEIGLAGNRTETGEIVGLKMNVIIPAGRIRKRLEARLGWRSREFRFTPAEQRQRRRLGFGALHCLNVPRTTINVQLSIMPGSNNESANQSERTGVIDMIAHDPKSDEAVLVMNEPEPWNDSAKRLFHLQERFNAYVSFLLDGEFAEWDPKLAQKRARIEVRCAHMPDSRALDLLGQIHDQLAHQEIDVQVVVKEQKH